MAIASLRKLAVAAIDATGRMRPLDPGWVEALADMMATEGQQTPLTVRQMAGENELRLIAGGHRLAAAQRLGWEEIDAEVIECSDDEATLREINENLARRNLTVLEEAVFLAQHKAVYERLYPSTKHGGDRVSEQAAKCATCSVPFAEAAAKDLNKSRKTITNRIALANALASSPELVEQLLKTPHADDASGLALLAGLEVSKRPQAVRLLLNAEEPLPSLTAAVDRTRGIKPKPPVDPQEAIFKRLVDAWGDANAATKRRFHEHTEAERRKATKAGRG